MIIKKLNRAAGCDPAGFTWYDVDVGAAPEGVGGAPFVGLAEQPDGAVTTFEVFGKVHFVS